MKRVGMLIACTLLAAGVVWRWTPVAQAARDLAPDKGLVQERTTDARADIKTPPHFEVKYVKRSFQATQAEVLGYFIHNRSELDRHFASTRELQQIADNLKQDFAIQKAKQVCRTTSNQNVLELAGTWRTATQILIILASFRESNGSGSTVLIVNLHSQEGQLDHLEHDANQVERIVTNLKFTPQISACIEGFTNARMVGVQADRLISQALSAVSAHPIEGVRSDLLTSISGYSSEIPGYIMSNGKQMNLQVAVHYDAYHHRTNVLVGTPIITETY
jgi:hypothetical protein